MIELASPSGAPEPIGSPLDAVCSSDEDENVRASFSRFRKVFNPPTGRSQPKQRAARSSKASARPAAAGHFVLGLKPPTLDSGFIRGQDAWRR